ALQLARERGDAAERSQDHLHQALATAIEGAAADRLGHPVVADRCLRAAPRMLVDREATGKLGEVCAMYADVLRRRGERDRAYAVMRMAAERDFSNLPALLRAGTRGIPRGKVSRRRCWWPTTRTPASESYAPCSSAEAIASSRPATGRRRCAPWPPTNATSSCARRCSRTWMASRSAGRSSRHPRRERSRWYC